MSVAVHGIGRIRTTTTFSLKAGLPSERVMIGLPVETSKVWAMEAKLVETSFVHKSMSSRLKASAFAVVVAILIIS